MKILILSVLFILSSLSIVAQPKDTKIYDSIVQATSIGAIAPDFSRKDINGRELRLSDFKGKYVLLDYWASWCSPCKAHTPVVKKLYNKFHSKGLEVIAISCDSEYDNWRKAVKDDSTEMFHNILSFTDEDMALAKGKVGSEIYRAATFKGELRKKYNLMPIPVEILINQNGDIIGRYLGYEAETDADLNKKLDKLLK